MIHITSHAMMYITWHHMIHITSHAMTYITWHHITWSVHQNHISTLWLLLKWYLFWQLPCSCAWCIRTLGSVGTKVRCSAGILRRQESSQAEFSRHKTGCLGDPVPGGKKNTFEQKDLQRKVKWVFLPMLKWTIFYLHKMGERWSGLIKLSAVITS